MSKNTDYLQLKWGTLKGWELEGNEKAIELIRKYRSLGMSMGAASQKDTPKQKEIICQLIDAIDGKIQNDWTGEYMTKKEAKDYVMNWDKS